MNKQDYTLKLIEMLALEMLSETPDHRKIQWVLETAMALRKVKQN
jgi:hypothetical protein